MNRKEFERVSPESVGISSVSIHWLINQLESGFTEPHGLIIMRHGKICTEGWWHPYAPGIRHGQQSHSKTYAATAVGIAYTEGLLGLDERLIDIFPEEAPKNPSENLKKLTIHHVLSMSNGMDEEPAPTKDWIRDFLATEVCHEPGTAYMYNSTGSSMLGAIVRKKTGLGLADYLKPRLFDKIGIDSSHMHWVCMPDGMEIGGGGLFATTEDNLRLMKLYADGGVWNGERILAEDYVQKAISFQMPTESERAGNPEADDNFLGYGYQIWMCAPKGVYRADGAMGQFTIVDPSRDLILAITENAAGAHWAQTTLDVIWKFLEQIPVSDAVLEDTPETETLKRRMSCLALPAPICRPYSPLSSLINDSTYQILDDKLHFEYVAILHKMAGITPPPPVAQIHFRISDTLCTLAFENQSGEKAVLTASMCGCRQQNILGSDIPNQALASAYWCNDNTLILTVKWIETCNTFTYHMSFNDNELTIKYIPADSFDARETTSCGRKI